MLTDIVDSFRPLLLEYYEKGEAPVTELDKILREMKKILVQKARAYTPPNVFITMAVNLLKITRETDQQQFLDSLIVLKLTRMILSQPNDKYAYKESLIDLANYCIIALSLLGDIDYCYFHKYDDAAIRDNMRTLAEGRNVECKNRIGAKAQRILTAIQIEQYEDREDLTRLSLSLAEVFTETTRKNGLLNLGAFSIVLLEKSLRAGSSLVKDGTNG